MGSVVDGYGYGYGSGSGYGSGDGYGYSYGSGYGSGDGYGYGDGYGSGSGDGYGYGYGSGYGYGYGSGYGSGDGYGYADGSGYGDGDGKEKYFSAILESVPREPSCTLAFWRSDKNGKPSNGGAGFSRKEGDIESIDGPLAICSQYALHATLKPENWKGERWWIVALYDPVIVQDDKMASLKRKIVKDLGACPF